MARRRRCVVPLAILKESVQTNSIHERALLDEVPMIAWLERR